MKKFALILSAVVALISLSACNTWHGFGKDMEKAGEAIQRSGSK